MDEINQSQIKKDEEKAKKEAIKRFSRLSPIEKIRAVQRWLKVSKRLTRLKSPH